jgi:hypothetical protein
MVGSSAVFPGVAVLTEQTYNGFIMRKFFTFAAFTLLALIVLSTAPLIVAKPTDAAKPEKISAAHEKLIANEKAVWDAYKQKDAKALGQLLAEDYYAIEDADGEIMSKAQAIQSVRSLELTNYEMKDVAVIPINDGSAIVRYKVKMEGAAFKHAFVPQWSMVSSVWVKRGGKWQNLMYQETKIGG